MTKKQPPKSMIEALRADAMKRPEVLPASHATSSPNEVIALYEGAVAVTQGAATATTTAKIQFEWGPTPRVRATFDNPSNSLDVGEAQLRIGNGPECAVLITDAPRGSSPDPGPCHALAAEAIVTEQRGSAVEVRFNLVNFPEFPGSYIRNADAGQAWAGRLEYFAGDWEVVVDQAPDFDAAVTRKLRATGGYMITHRGRLRRRDRGTIDVDAVLEQVKVLGYVLSFYRGAWTSPFLLSGFDGSGVRVWELWNSPRTSPWTLSHQNWGRDGSPKHALFRLHEALLGPWSEALPLAIHWYVEANNDTLAESSIVRCQIALELLCWEILVAREKSLSKSGHGRLAAADNFRLAMAFAGIPLPIPDTLPDLQALSKAFADEASDAAGAFTFVRNAIVHPDEKKREALKKAPREIRKQARALGLWLVELMILSVAGYEYEYADRLDGYAQKKLPWSRSPGASLAALVSASAAAAPRPAPVAVAKASSAKEPAAKAGGPTSKPAPKPERKR